VTLLKNLKLTALLVVLAYSVSGCMVIRNEVKPPADAPISFGPSIDGQKEVVRRFESSGRATYWFLYLIPKNHLNGYDLALREIAAGEAIQNLSITTQHDFVDWLCGFISIVFGTYRIDVEGEVVKA